MYQKVFYKTNIKVPAVEPFTGMVPVAALPSGTMQLTVFDDKWQPVAERVAFINNNNFTINTAVDAKQVSTQKRGKNSIEITVNDTIPANMSLSISDADMNNEPTGNTIVTDLLLKGDIKGYVHDPAYYFTNNNDAALKAKLDLVMLTNGWRRYNWADMMVQKMPLIRTAPDEYLAVYGQIGEEAMKKMGKGEPVNLLVKTKDSISTFYSVLPAASGIIKQSGLVFYDSARVYYTFNKSKLLNKQMGFSKHNFTLNQPLAITNYKDHLLPDTSGTAYNPKASLFNYYKNNNGVNLFNDEKTMQNVVLKTGGWRNWQNDPLLKMDQKYTGPMFSAGATGYSVDVLHDEKSWTKLDFFQYLRTAMPSVGIGNFNLTEGRTLTYMGKKVLVFIDENQMMGSELESLSLSEVAYIKLIPYFLGSGPNEGGAGLQPALAVYTKKGDDRIDRRPTDKDMGMVKVAGYSPLKEFYSPDYTQGNTGGTDARTTLLWMPYILTDKANLKVPVSFYNNDFTKKMRLVLEGINADGKMIHIEKIIE
jgi:hypothetical protein